MSRTSKAPAEAPTAAIPFLAPLTGESRTAEVARQLEESIELGLLPAGAKLPPEGELAEQLGVSAMTLRDALASLREQGLLVTRRGRGGGSFVQAPSGRRRSGSAALRAYSVNDLRDLLDHHRAITTAIAALAAERAGESDQARLRADDERFERAGSAPERRRADARFHVDLAVAAHSARLTSEEVRFQGEISGLLWLLPGAGPDLEAHRAGHGEIIAALAARDPEAARFAADAQAAAAAEALLERRLAVSS
jgi:GntR family transcriptional regulator, transcriptional repressor for pyruvate dehydrogenase complex